MPFRIPDRHKNAFAEWLRLAEGLAEAFTTAVEDAAPHLMRRDFVAEVTASCPGLGDAQVVGLLDFFFNMAMTFKNTRDEHLEAFVDDVFAQVSGDIEDAAGSWKRRRDETLRILASSAMVVTAKALLVMTEHDRMFLNARVFSELRPVFDEPTMAPQALVGIHQLKVEFRRSDQERDAMFFALDRADLVKLRDVVDRAIAKHDALRAIASNAGIPLLEEEDRDAASG